MAGLSTGDNVPDVVVTAVASSTALAPDAEQTWQQLREGQSGIRALDKPFVDEFGSAVRIGGALPGRFHEHLERAAPPGTSVPQSMCPGLCRRVWDAPG